MQHVFDFAFGVDAESISWWQMALRAVLIFFFGILVLRFAHRRFFGQSTDFDIVVAVLVGSTLSRALTGNARLLPTLAATTVLVILHGVLAHIAGRWQVVGALAKGVETRLIDRGRIDRGAMRRSGITERDIMEAVRLKGTEDLSRVDVAVLERNGRISVILKEADKPDRP